MSDLPILDSEVKWYNVYDYFALDLRISALYDVSCLTVETCERSILYVYHYFVLRRELEQGQPSW
jgi:hypothetical protein